MMNILHEIHKLYPGPQETPFISEATDFFKENHFQNSKAEQVKRMNE